MAPEAGWGDDPVRPFRCLGLQASPFQKNPAHPYSLDPSRAAKPRQHFASLVKLEVPWDLPVRQQKQRPLGNGSVSPWKRRAQESSRVGGDSTCPRLQAQRRRKHRKEEDAGVPPARATGPAGQSALPSIERKGHRSSPSALWKTNPQRSGGPPSEATAVARILDAARRCGRGARAPGTATAGRAETSRPGPVALLAKAGGPVSIQSSQGVYSPILAGKRELNVRQLRALSERFGVSPSVFV